MLTVTHKNSAAFGQILNLGFSKNQRPGQLKHTSMASSLKSLKVRNYLSAFLLLIYGAVFSQIPPPVYYPDPMPNIRHYDEPDDFVDISSRVYSPLTMGYGYFNFHMNNGDISNRNISFLSFEINFPVMMSQRMKRDEIFRFNQLLPIGTVLDGKEVEFKGCQLSALSQLDVIHAQWITLGINYGFSFGSRKMISLYNGERFKIKNPFTGIQTGLDLRFNVGRKAGLSFGGFAHYMVDISKNRWINKKGYPFTLPKRTKFTGWQIGAAIGFILFEDAIID